jgi:glycosidase
MKIRAANPALRSGDQRILPSPSDVLAVERRGAGESLLILANLSDHLTSYPASGRDLLSSKRIAGAVKLRPFEATIIRR